MSDVRWLDFNFQFSIFNFFCALGREKIFAGLRQIFRCLARHFHLYYRHCKGTNFSAYTKVFFSELLVKKCLIAISYSK